MRSIHVFDDIQRKDAKEQAERIRGSGQPFQECIEFGRDWAKAGLASAQWDYEEAKRIGEYEEQSVEAKRAQLLRELEELEASA